MVTREAAIGAILGVALGAIALGLVYVLTRALEVALVVSITLLVVSVMATLAGGALPFLFRRINVDPALVSAPLITTIMDISGVALYFGIAYMVMLR